MRFVLTHILAFIVLAAGSGLVGMIHRAEHGEGSRQVSAHNQFSAAEPMHAEHDEAACAMCATLHAPLQSSPGETVLARCAGRVFVLHLVPESRHVGVWVPIHLPCRGPPIEVV